MILFKGVTAAFNYTYGPALIYRGPSSIDDIYKRGEPVVVVADIIPIEELRKIELTRVRGFVFEKGNAAQDEEVYNFLMTEKRAAVISCEGVSRYICDDDMVIVDGVEGMVCLEPTDEILAAFQATRVQGPPSDRSTQIQQIARGMLEGLVKEREEAEARGEKIVKTGDEHVMTPAEAKKAWESQPGLIYQMLSGIPLPNSPTAGAHGHEHAMEVGALSAKGDPSLQIGHDDPHDGHEGHAHGDEHEHEHEKTAGGVEQAKAEGAAEGAAPADSPASRRAAREAEIQAARASRRGDAPAT